MGSESESARSLFKQSLELMPWHARWKLKARWLARGLWRAITRRIPGYNAFRFAVSRIRRQGWSGLYEPPFNIAKQDRAAFDKRLRWHGWGVLQEDGGFRGYTPTRRTVESFRRTDEAWSALASVYHGRADGTAWAPLNPQGPTHG